MTRLRMLQAAGGAALAACAMMACDIVFGVHNADVDASVDDGGIVDAPYDYVVHDAIDLDVNTAICDGGVAPVDPSAAVWVSGNDAGTNHAGCGTPDDPCATIGFALTQLGARKVVYLDHAIFVENVSLGSSLAGVTIQGGFERSDGGWAPQCTTGLSVIQGADNGGSAAVDIVGTNGVTLRLLTVQSKANGALDESVYAVRVTSSTDVLLDNVSMLAQNGGQGTVGSNGSTPSCIVGGQGSATPGGSGGPGVEGAIGPSGYVVFVAGDGGSGGTGASTPGEGGACGPCVTACF